MSCIHGMKICVENVKPRAIRKVYSYAALEQAIRDIVSNGNIGWTATASVNQCIVDNEDSFVHCCGRLHCTTESRVLHGISCGAGNSERGLQRRCSVIVVIQQELSNSHANVFFRFANLQVHSP
eukprot:TRINITY_DN24743_c0_g3_i2.p1 TRINITY_DN24743_c0_g3~~TRINITY_DN24743_c0_g3_i2.p1  ORF type:complete len:124 (-),score=22.74 TRINITY_DN24743_c0_g3_i2:137-508(-)